MVPFYALGDDQPPQRWIAPWPYDLWRATVLKDEELSEEWLQKLYVEQWEPQELYKTLLHGKFFKAHPKPKVKTVRERRVSLDLEAIQKRIAKAVWVECSRLVLRHQTPEAREYLNKIRDQAQAAAGIIVG